METLEQTDAPVLREVFVVDSEAKVNWLLSLLANLDAEAARIKAQTDTRLRQIANERQGLLYQYEADLKAFAAQEIAKQKGKRKSVVLMQGTLSFRTVPASVKVADDESAFAYAVAEGLAAAQKTVLNKEEYRKLAEARLLETGEQLPGIEVTPEQEAFSIKFPKGEKDNATSEN
jgi:phage host-nuclease inhibitor protein Gam